MTQRVLRPGERHPAREAALTWLYKQCPFKLARWQERFDRAAISGDRSGEICGETLFRFLNGEAVEDRYLLGLVLTMRCGEEVW